MKCSNEGAWDRIVRIVAGVGLFYAAWSVWGGLGGFVLSFMGAMAVATGVAGCCPAYSLFHLSTRKAGG